MFGGEKVDKKLIGKRIKEARLNREMTQQQLADEVDKTIVYISEIERGIKLPSLTLFVQLAQALEVSADSLLRDDLDASKTYVYHEITAKMEALTPKQRAACVEILDAYIRNA